MSDWIWALIIGFVLDLLLGDPSWLYHPVCIIGKYIGWMEKKLRRRGGNLRKSAVFLTASTVLLTMAVVALILMLCGLLGRIPLLIAMALLDWMGIAITSMAKEARGVEKALGQGVAAGRTQVARIVGRDTQDLSEEEIIKATVETVSENTTDGVISPLLYAAIGGPILLWGFKAASTLDSMVGYLDEKYRDIGWSSARLDDVLNYIPARIVGRDTQELSEEEIIKATVETVSENTTDGVISPLLYAAIGGPILLWGFKAASTLDSMVGYLDEKYRDIGWSSARLDDVLNYIPARLTALLMVIASYLIGLDGKNAFRIVRRDHANHKSPNCAWSESAAAGALHIQLGGTHNYFGKPVEKPTIGDADRPAERADIRRANRLLYTSSLLMMALIVLIAIAR